MLLTPAQIKPKWFELRRNSFFTRGGCASCLRVCLGARLLPQSSQYPNLSEGADQVGGQLRTDKECPFSGITKSGRVWRECAPSVHRTVRASQQVTTGLKHQFQALTIPTGQGGHGRWQQGHSTSFKHWGVGRGGGGEIIIKLMTVVT